MIKRDRYSSISLDLLLEYRTVLARRTDTSGATSWTAKVVGMPWCEASGSTRTEALRRVREMAGGKGSGRPVDLRPQASRGSREGNGATPSNVGRALEGAPSLEA